MQSQWQKPALYAGVMLILLGTMVAIAFARSTGKGHIEAVVHVARPAAVVFPWLVEPAKRIQWVDSLAQSTLQPAGPVTVGTTLVDTVDVEGERKEVRTTVKAYAPPRNLATAAETTSYDQTTRCDLADEPGGTAVTCVSDVDFHGWVARLIAPTIANSFKSRMDADLLRLKTKIEAGPAH